jgi:hypothetical protein
MNDWLIDIVGDQNGIVVRETGAKGTQWESIGEAKRCIGEWNSKW